MDSVGIVGAGLMGTGIAAVFAVAGIQVVLHDAEPSRLEALPDELKRIAAALRDAALVTAATAAEFPSMVRVTPEVAAMAGQMMVIEAVPEHLAIKHHVYEALEEVLDASAIIASNTSGLMPTDLARAMRCPGRFLVAHFWNPPYAIPLVEVVPSLTTAPKTLDTMVSLLRRIGQHPVVLRKEIPGFIGNRLQYALLREALAIVRSGAATVEEVDSVMRVSLGRRLGITGPIETADLGGLDTFLSIAEQLMPHLAKDEGVLDLMRARVTAGKVGPRSGEGFYLWPPERVAALRGARDRELLRCKLQDRGSNEVGSGQPQPE